MKRSEVKIQIPANVQKILEVLEASGYEGYIVGGCVRDRILGRRPNDWDICTNCPPEKMLDIFSMFKTIPTGFKHGTVTLVIQGENYEVTAYRIDGDYIDGRHPGRVIFTNELKEDLKRRDFTMNAMAYNDRIGLVDYYGGIQDILNKKIRCVGNPLERFQEDYLRMLRAIRFAAQLDYGLEEETLYAIKTLAQNITRISAERKREELNKILLSHRPSKGFALLHISGLLKYILPELEKCVGFHQHNPHHDKDVFNHILSVMDHTEGDLILRLSALFHDVGKPETFSLDEEGIGHFYKHNIKSSEMAEEIMKRLKYDNKSIQQVVTLVKEHMLQDDLSHRAIKGLIKRVGPENIHRLFKLRIADIKASAKKGKVEGLLNLQREAEKILTEKQPLSTKDLAVNGHDLMGLGIAEGKQVGMVLNKLMEMVLQNPELNQKDSLLRLVSERFLGK